MFAIGTCNNEKKTGNADLIFLFKVGQLSVGDHRHFSE
jgi:hypothetical protein